MKRIVFVVILLTLVSGCVFTHTYHSQRSSADLRKWLYTPRGSGGARYIEEPIDLFYERHLFTDKSDIEILLSPNPLVLLVHIPCGLLLHLPFGWLWSGRRCYTYRMPVKCDDSIEVTRYWRKLSKDRSTKWMMLTWVPKSDRGPTNLVRVTLSSVDDKQIMREMLIEYWQRDASGKGMVLKRKVVPDVMIEQTGFEMYTYDGRHLYVWCDWGSAIYLYGCYRWDVGRSKTDWNPIAMEIDLETGGCRRLLWTERDRLCCSDDVVLRRFKDEDERDKHFDANGTRSDP